MHANKIDISKAILLSLEVSLNGIATTVNFDFQYDVVLKQRSTVLT